MGCVLTVVLLLLTRDCTCSVVAFTPWATVLSLTICTTGFTCPCSTINQCFVQSVRSNPDSGLDWIACDDPGFRNDQNWQSFWSTVECERTGAISVVNFL
jgi:hypothetical protein